MRLPGHVPSQYSRAVLPLESVPNFSEGRDRATIDAIGAALARARARCSTCTPTPTTTGRCSRSSATTAQLVEALVAGGRGRARADRPARCTRARTRGSARPTSCRSSRCGRSTWSGRARPRSGSASALGALGLPVFVYAPPERGPAFYRRGGVEGLQRRLDAGELEPDFGPARLDPSAGGVIVGARRPLIAFNVNLRGTLEAAREIAAVVRERGGGFPGVRALGLELPRAGLVQVSMNVEDWEAAALHEIVARDRREAAARGAEVAGSELVGLMPAGAAAAAAGRDAPDRGLRRVAAARAPPARRVNR